MNRRITKQIIITLIIFLVLSIIVFLVHYFQRPKLTCFDGIRNQNEEEVDCGGPCLPCELVHIKEIEVISTEVIFNQGNFYDIFAQINNPNQNYGGKQVPYEFELYNSKNDFVVRHTGLTFILPGQTKYLIQSKIESVKPISAVNLSFGKIEWEKLENEQAIDLVIQQKEYRLLGDDEPGFSQARGVLINKTNFDFEKINIDILLFDASYQLIGLGATEIKTLLAGEERDFVAVWFNQINSQVAFVEMEAETNLFDYDNYIPAGGEKEKFQEY